MASRLKGISNMNREQTMVLKYIRANKGKICCTTYQMQKHLGLSNATARISELRNMGYDIPSPEYRGTINGKRIFVYTIHEKEE